MQTLYNQKRYIEPADGNILIFARGTSPEEYEVTTAYAQYRIIARSLENATQIYNDKVLPEIKRKERLYIASGKFDQQNN